MTKIWAKTALLPEGWQDDVLVQYDDRGLISFVEVGAACEGASVDILLASPGNLHSHSFQRAMAGMTESRGEDPTDSFWTWRKLMYQFVEALTPEDVAAIAAFQQMETLEAGFASTAEFHYLHHQADGTPYDNVAELSEAIMSGATMSGIGLTLLPVLYQRGGCDNRPLSGGQLRFGNDIDRYSKLYETAAKALTELSSDARIGVAPHSLRAVNREGLVAASNLASKSVKHIHIAEQQAEVDQVLEAYGARPVEWLMANADVDESWCLVHATQMVSGETQALANSGAVAGLCPITESNLGDGIFDGVRFQEAGGRFGIGSDSNVYISLSEELRTLEYSQRLQTHRRVVYGDTEHSCGRALYDGALMGGALATGRKSGRIEQGYFADLVALNADKVNLLGQKDDGILDAYIFAGNDNYISDVWAAGRHMVKNGLHRYHAPIKAEYIATLQRLKSSL